MTRNSLNYEWVGHLVTNLVGISKLWVKWVEHQVSWVIINEREHDKILISSDENTPQISYSNEWLLTKFKNHDLKIGDAL